MSPYMADILLNDDEVLNVLGNRLTARRIALGLTQAKLATEAGVSKRTVERMEAGHSAEIVTWIRVLRVLGILGNLQQMIPQAGPTPMQLLQQQKKSYIRKRAPRKDRTAGQAKKKAQTKPWVWGEDR